MMSPIFGPFPLFLIFQKKMLNLKTQFSEKTKKFRGRFLRKILLNDYEIWQFSINP